jgi:hypothetical protein
MPTWAEAILNKLPESLSFGQIKLRRLAYLLRLFGLGVGGEQAGNSSEVVKFDFHDLVPTDFLEAIETPATA